MRKQSEGLTKEYDRLLEEHTKIQVSMPRPAVLDGRPLCTEEAAALLLQALQEALAVGAAPSLSLPLSPLLLSLGPAAFLGQKGCGLADGSHLLRWAWPHAQHQCREELFPCVIPIPGLVSTPVQSTEGRGLITNQAYRQLQDWPLAFTL